MRGGVASRSWDVGEVVAIPTGAANAYAIQGRDGVTLVDVGMERTLPRIDRALRRHGSGLGAVVRVLITHAHVDHVGALARLQATQPLVALAHAEDAPYVRAGEHPPTPEPATLGPIDRALARLSSGRPRAARVDHELTGGERLDAVAPGATVVHLPGHTPGHVGLWLPERRLLLGGDVALHLLPWRLSLPFAAFSSDLGQAVASVERAAELGPERLGLGHGPPLRRGATERLRALARRTQRRR